MDKRIYKYCSVNQYSLDILRISRLYCNHYSAFNDPFECWCLINSGIPDPVSEVDRFLNVIGVWGFSSERKDDALEYYNDYLQALEDDQIDVSYHLDTARISCFSTDPQNLLMWAHYADGLRGFCIEFDGSLLSSSGKGDAEILDVVYLEQPPVLERISYPLANDIYWHGENEDSDKAVEYMHEFYQKMLATKPLEWRYECEARLIFHSKAQGNVGEFYNFQNSAIKSVIVGEKISDANKDVLKRTLEEVGLKIPLKVAKRNRNTYKVLITEDR